MQKKYTSLGLMSGTSGDGVDASLIISNGINQFEVIKNNFPNLPLSICFLTNLTVGFSLFCKTTNKLALLFLKQFKIS